MIAAYVLQRSSRRLGYEAKSEYTEKDRKAQAPAERAEVERELARLQEPSATQPPAANDAAGAAGAASATVDADPLAGTLTRLLEMPRLVPFRETPLPATSSHGVDRRRGGRRRQG